jgi:ribose-phosphate pyrophosphokinase
MIFSGRSNIKLAEELARATGLALGNIVIEKFSDGEIYVRIKEDVKDQVIFVFQSLCYPASENLIELLIIIDALKRLSPKKIVAILPFYAYRRQERVLEKGESITASLVAKLLETAGIDEAVLVDIHSDKILDFFTVPVISLEVFDLFADYFTKLKIDNALVVSPDHGALADAQRLAGKLNLRAVSIVKKRDIHDAVALMVLEDDVTGKNIFMIDDEIDTAGTISRAAELLKSKGAGDIYIGCTHSIFSGPAIERLTQAPIKQIITTNTIPVPESKMMDKLSVLSIAPVLARVINEMKK